MAAGQGDRSITQKAFPAVNPQKRRFDDVRRAGRTGTGVYALAPQRQAA